MVPGLHVTDSQLFKAACDVPLCGVACWLGLVLCPGCVVMSEWVWSVPWCYNTQAGERRDMGLVNYAAETKPAEY